MCRSTLCILAPPHRYRMIQPRDATFSSLSAFTSRQFAARHPLGLPPVKYELLSRTRDDETPAKFRILRRRRSCSNAVCVEIHFSTDFSGYPLLSNCAAVVRFIKQEIKLPVIQRHRSNANICHTFVNAVVSGKPKLD